MFVLANSYTNDIVVDRDIESLSYINANQAANVELNFNKGDTYSITSIKCY